MSWALLILVILVLGLSLFAAITRRAEMTRMSEVLADREVAVQRGSARPTLQYPDVDLSLCLGCATCVAACPEEGVLAIVHGQAMVVHGARCVGISACERECPVGAITVSVAGLDSRKDIPAIGDPFEFEAIGSPGLFLAGEVTGQALVATAIRHGATVTSEIASRVKESATTGSDVLDLCIIGCGPAGMAASLEAKSQGLNFVTLDQADEPGGTVAKYPRAKLIMTQPVDLPIYGRLKKTAYIKEELIELWDKLVSENQLPIKCNEVFGGLNKNDEGNFVVRTEENSYTARYVLLAIGRRGSPRKLGVPGEELPKLLYSLVDASTYTNSHILVVGGGDSAVEAAMGLAEQEGNKVTLSYRKNGFFRIKARNETRLEKSIADGVLDVLYESQVLQIEADSVKMSVKKGEGKEELTLQNDHIFVMAGGIPPFKLLESAGVSFDPTMRKKLDPLMEQGTGLMRAVAIGLILALAALAWATWHGSYYLLPAVERPQHVKHDLLRPSQGVGLALGITAVVMMFINLAYLPRRSPKWRFNWGSLQVWMTSHIATGILAFLGALLHGAMAPRNTVGGHAYWGFAALLVTGAIGRYLYACVPHAASGRELALEEVQSQLGKISEEWDQDQKKYRQRVRKEVKELIASQQWKGTVVGRLRGIITHKRGLNKVIARLHQQGMLEGVPEDQIRDTMRLARRAFRTSMMAAHYEDIRTVVSSWRYLHRWLAALTVLLVVVHVVYALLYADLFGGGAM